MSGFHVKSTDPRKPEIVAAFRALWAAKHVTKVTEVVENKDGTVRARLLSRASGSWVFVANGVIERAGCGWAVAKESE